MLNQIQKDLLLKHIGPFLFCFLTVMFILLMQFLILHVDKLVGKGLEFGIVVELILSNIAYMVVLATPMAVLVSTLMAFGKFSEWNELTALKAAGVNPISLLKPVLVVAGVMFLFLTYFSNEVLPEANHKARSLFIDIRMKKPGFDLQPGVFYTGINGYTFLVREIPAGADSLKDITLFQEPRQGRYRAVIQAENGRLVSNDELTLSLHLVEGSILRFIPGERRGEETIEHSWFSRYRISFDLSELSFSRSNPEQRTRNERTMTGQAMLAYIDTMYREREEEYQSFFRQFGDFPISTETGIYIRRSEHAGSVRPGAGPPDIYHSRFGTLNKMDKVEEQEQLISIALAQINGYQGELNNLDRNMNRREIRIAEFMVDVHKKIALPYACIMFVLLGGPIGMMTRKGNIGVAALISSVLLTIYFIGIIQGEKLADRLVITPFMGMWSFNILFTLIGLLLLLHVSTSFKLTNLLPPALRNREWGRGLQAFRPDPETGIST
ncbi:MAG: LptF/LptG family permease [Balneolaceae bacterium]